MDGLYKLFDRFSEMIPAQLLPVIRLAAILVWVLLAGIVAILAWGQGSESAPQMGQELSLAEIKARQQREANLQKPQNVRIPDLNELIPERPREPVQYESPRRADSGDDRRGLIQSDSNLIEPRNPADDPLYRGEGLAPRDRTSGPVPGDSSRTDSGPEMLPVGPRDYQPARDAGVGGVRDSSGGNAPGGRNQAAPLPVDSGVGLDGKPLNAEDGAVSSPDRDGRSNANTNASARSENRASPVGAERKRAAPPRSSQSSGDLPLLD
ncbi:MAG: hypothetical protein NXI24_17745 [bacterium]|nr:hypothetical protein [bacterium]